MWFKRQKKPSSAAEYQTEFRRLTNDLWNQFAIEDTPFDELLEAMVSVENELNRNGGCNWDAKDYVEYADTIWRLLSTANQFTPGQLAEIRHSLDEIIACGRELEDRGESRRNVTPAIDCLVARVVDWCRAHPKQTNDEV